MFALYAEPASARAASAQWTYSAVIQGEPPPGMNVPEAALITNILLTENTRGPAPSATVQWIPAGEAATRNDTVRYADDLGPEPREASFQLGSGTEVAITPPVRALTATPQAFDAMLGAFEARVTFDGKPVDPAYTRYLGLTSDTIVSGIAAFPGRCSDVSFDAWIGNGTVDAIDFYPRVGDDIVETIRLRLSAGRPLLPFPFRYFLYVARSFLGEKSNCASRN